MRLISQNGKMDVNYDLVHLSIERNRVNSEWRIVARDRFDGDLALILAVYSSKEKVKAVFEAVSYEFCNGKGAVMFMSDEEVEI